MRQSVVQYDKSVLLRYFTPCGPRPSIGKPRPYPYPLPKTKTGTPSVDKWKKIG